MARNEEKAQSMLYRFREAQAAELGLGTRADKRPRVASGCQSLRECERWRGDILREISRKVSKIQDSGLTDYEVRDLNDEINRLLREKRHWENQIVSLGGANYRRNVAMLDDDGREVPGTKGYKYFGRAKDLPGVRELFQSKKKEEEEENAVYSHYKKFMDQSGSYYGDGTEELDEEEREEEKLEWEEMRKNVINALNLPEEKESTLPSFPLSKGKAKPPNGKANVDTMQVDSDPQKQAAELLASYLPVFGSQPELLMPPSLPTRAEMEGVLLDLRKRALVGEYFGET